MKPPHHEWDPDLTESMNDQSTTDELDIWLDRLVDGEISEQHRRELLEKLNHLSDGWRRCGLAFLQDQALKDACGDFTSKNSSFRDTVSRDTVFRDTVENRRQADSASPATAAAVLALENQHRGPSIVGVTHVRRRWRPAIAVISAAASFLVAFGLSVAGYQLWNAPESGITPVVGGSDSSPSPNSAVDDANPPIGQWGTVQFVVDGPGGAPEEVQLPAIDGPEPEAWLSQQPSPSLPQFIEQLRQLGHRLKVKTRREYMPVPLDDGREAVFPVDGIEIRFVGGHGYQ